MINMNDELTIQSVFMAGGIVLLSVFLVTLISNWGTQQCSVTLGWCQYAFILTLMLCIGVIFIVLSLLYTQVYQEKNGATRSN